MTRDDSDRSGRPRAAAERAAGGAGRSACCGGGAGSGAAPGGPGAGTEERGPSVTISREPDGVRSTVREKYGAAARGEGCCGVTSDPPGALAALGYTEEDAAALPPGANLGLGCGNPLAFADVRPGETVLDLGSGAGIDCFLAAGRVGAGGRVIGVDMTPEMIDRARANAVRGGFSNVEFRLGEIENLPVADGAVDLVISNCVINLSPDKPRVFREARRVLRPGGRLLVSDLVLLEPLPEELAADVALYVGCIAGAALREEYLRMIREAGFDPVEVVAEGRYTVGEAELPAGDPRRDAFRAVSSVKVRAGKPEAR